MPVFNSMLISCEHAGNMVPAEYCDLFTGAKEILQSHRGWDPGAYPWAMFVAGHWNLKVHAMTVTRLLIEMNRSLDSPSLFSEFSRSLPDAEREKLIRRYYHPYRTGLVQEIKALKKPVLHLSFHSFTPVWNGTERTVDIGLLFDPERELEATFCVHLAGRLYDLLPEFRIRFNEPYAGTDDGIATAMRQKFPGVEYLGIELEINQRFVNTPQSNHLQEALAKSLKEVML